ncbi:MAG: DUF5652 family protein [Candidatus Woesearchaeota archaeon]
MVMDPYYGISSGFFALLVIAALWDMVWKGIGLWRAGRNNQLGWFVALFIFNTVGILPILYIAFFQKKPAAAKPAPKKRK